MNNGTESPLICYCFSYTRADIENDLRTNAGKSLIMVKILATQKAGGCNCASTNPKGR